MSNDPNPGARPPAAQRLKGVMLHERGIALNSATGETFRLVGPAVQLARLLQQGANVNELLAYLLENYDVDRATAQRDLDAFLTTLEEMDWLEAVA